GIDLTTTRVPAAFNNSAPLVMYWIDHEIRRATGGQRSLDDAVRTLAREQGTLTTASFLRAVNQVAGRDFTPLFRRHVYRGEPPPAPAREDENRLGHCRSGEGGVQLGAQARHASAHRGVEPGPGRDGARPGRRPPGAYGGWPRGRPRRCAPHAWRALGRLDRRAGRGRTSAPNPPPPPSPPPPPPSPAPPSPPPS